MYENLVKLFLSKIAMITLVTISKNVFRLSTHVVVHIGAQALNKLIPEP